MFPVEHSAGRSPRWRVAADRGPAPGAILTGSRGCPTRSACPGSSRPAGPGVGPGVDGRPGRIRRGGPRAGHRADRAPDRAPPDASCGRGTSGSARQRIATNARLAPRRSAATARVPAQLPGAGSEVRYLQPGRTGCSPRGPTDRWWRGRRSSRRSSSRTYRRQRVVPVPRDVLGRPTTTADARDPAVAGALQRARDEARAAARPTGAPPLRTSCRRTKGPRWRPGRPPTSATTPTGSCPSCARTRSAVPPDPGVLVAAESATDVRVPAASGGRGHDVRRCTVTTADRAPAIVERLRTPGHPPHRLSAVDLRGRRVPRHRTTM